MFRWRDDMGLRRRKKAAGIMGESTDDCSKLHSGSLSLALSEMLAV